MIPAYQNHTTVNPDPGHVNDMCLYQYIDLAKKCLHGMKEFELLKNDDAISFVVEEMMIAAQNYDPNRSSLATHMVNSAKFGVKHWRRSCYQEQQQQKKHRAFMVSNATNYAGFIKDSDGIGLDTQLSPVDQLIEEDTIAEQQSCMDNISLLKGDVRLTRKQARCVDFARHDFTPTETGQHMTLSRNSVSEHLKHAKRKLRRAFKERVNE